MELTLGYVRSMKEYTSSPDIKALCDLAEQAFLMKAALSPEMAEEIAREHIPSTQRDALNTYAKAARGERCRSG